MSLDLSVCCRTSKREVPTTTINENLTIEIAQASVGQLIPLKINGIILNSQQSICQSPLRVHGADAICELVG